MPLPSNGNKCYSLETRPALRGRREHTRLLGLRGAHSVTSPAGLRVALCMLPPAAPVLLGAFPPHRGRGLCPGTRCLPDLSPARPGLSGSPLWVAFWTRDQTAALPALATSGGNARRRGLEGKGSPAACQLGNRLPEPQFPHPLHGLQTRM